MLAGIAVEKRVVFSRTRTLCDLPQDGRKQPSPLVKVGNLFKSPLQKPSGKWIDFPNFATEIPAAWPGSLIFSIMPSCSQSDYISTCVPSITSSLDIEDDEEDSYSEQCHTFLCTIFLPTN
jgi:hypothetical protein